MNDGEVRAQIDRILASATFAEAERARKFLRFIVEATLAGRTGEIKESVIGVEVLGRAASFDPRTDPIVRVEAGRLRTRLLSYYHSEGSADPLVIDLPKGGYVPQFQRRSAGALTAQPSSNWRAPLLLVLASLFAILSFWGAWSYLRRGAQPGREPIRLSILPPAGSILQNAALSPDGHYIAFTATSDKVTRLWIRPLDSVEPRPVAGTEGAAYPFWSPDSKSVAFFAPEKLRRIPISGGPAETICDVNAAFGGSWGARGIIVFAQRPNGAIFQVPAEGGAPAAVTLVDRAHGEIAHLFPHFLPDGRRFLYSVISRAPAEPSLRDGSLDGQPSKFLLTADVGGAYAPPYAGRSGLLLFAYHGALMSQPFDAGTGKLSGAASQIAPEVRHVQSRADFSVASNGVLAYRGKTEKERQLTWFDRSGKELGTAGPANNYESVQLSPDDQHVAIQDSDNGRSELWIMNLVRGSFSRIGAEGAEAFAPVWSADGKELIFTAVTTSGMQLFRQAVDNVNAVTFLDGGGVKIPTDWSRDGKFVAYSRFLIDAGIWIKPVSASAQDKGRFYGGGSLECCTTFSPAISGGAPRWIAYSSRETGQDEVYVKPFPAGDRKWQVSTHGGWLPRWRRDGRELFYLALDGKLMGVNIANAHASDFASGTPKSLFATTILPFRYPALPGNSYAVAADGQRFLVNYNYASKRGSSDSITILLPSP